MSIPKHIGPRTSGRLGGDAIGWYLSRIGKEPLLTPSEEIELAHQVQALKVLMGTATSEQQTVEYRKAFRSGRRARNRMIAANLRLVFSVAKKYQHQGLELLDLIQEGTIGLERAVDKFNPSMGYKFSTYAYWWIRQSMVRAIDNTSRTIRLPIHIGERLTKLRRVTRDLSHRLGRQPNRLEISHRMEMSLEELDKLVAQSQPCVSLDAHVRGDGDRSTIGELIGHTINHEPLEEVDRRLQQENLESWMAQLDQREQKVLRQRYGLEGTTPQTLSAIGHDMKVSRERVRQLQERAIKKLKASAARQKAA
ncbi:sigma-70 family RNA polymerase sigma factor [Candidatus Synechococcus spongiarum]|uniref:Cyanobacteria-specific RpoD-like sigma factor,type-13 n=1 Tax=Candidatus Synechococcus spongiarum TaxID=431041 RepID=A0A161KBF0_9SYNE|nr:sigma-70 family RNA polymerase sigma factor [Candidatus Synechococcus spongiarum]CZB19174.1 Cyanobacteria-specific RpoD-like sigma factor,type-13 [Candidatus Synechococcus spongiarum]